MTTKEIRETYGVTQKMISEIFDISLATIKNWDSRETMPKYVHKMMDMYFHQRIQIVILEQMADDEYFESKEYVFGVGLGEE